ncbi:nucleolar protein 11-like [Littorina saxatilis]|uniref:nucleolar protein 11-like n=1 Tax=Littorina saxatilis TaxID=31220 RepID=UPI0038B68528
MAALTEPVPVTVEPSLCGIESGREEDTVIISSKKSFINTLKLSDQKLVSSLPVRVGVNISSPAVWNEEKKEYFLVQNNQEVLMWKEGHTLLDKAKKRQIPTAVHKLFSLPSYEPVVLCENGTVTFLGGGIKGGNQKALLSEGECITWCTAVELLDGVCVVHASCSKVESNGDTVIHSHWYSAHEDLWKHTATRLESHGALLSCTCCRGPSQDDVRLFTLWSDGSLHDMVLSETSAVERGQPIFLKGLSASCSLFCLSDNDFAIVGLQKKDQRGVAILDQKFGQIRAWQPFPFKGSFDKAFCQREHILVHCGKTLYIHRYECQVSTLASMIGHRQGTLAEEEPSPADAQLSPRKRSKSAESVEEPAEKQIVKILKNLCDPLKTSSYTAFKREFAQLKTKLPDSDVWAFLEDLSLVVKRCCTEKKFWPADELEFLVSQHCVSASDVAMLFEALLQRKDVGLMYKAMTAQSDELPETCVCFALHCFLSATEEAVQVAVENVGLDLSNTEMEEEGICMYDAGDEAAACPFSREKAFLVDQILCCPFDEAYLLSSMRQLPFNLVVDLLKYILHKLKHPAVASDKNVEQDNQRLSQLSRWEAIALDAHATQFIMAKDAHELVIKFSEEEDRYVSFITEANRELSEKLKHMMTKTADKQKKVVGQYCIEVLHLI